LAPVPFSLVKWYMDCVTERGDTAILYCADIRFRGLRGSYSSILLADQYSSTTRSSVGRLGVHLDGQRFQVDFPRLNASGTWTAEAPAVEHVMYANPSGSVHWNCLQPASSVRLAIGGRELVGLGYAECLTLTLPPWQLPMRQLKWGRFVSERDSLAWIDRRGPYSVQIGVHNGSKHENLTISDNEISLAGATLRLSETLALRSGTLGSTVLPGLPALAKLLPGNLFNIDEKKWRSLGVLEAQGRQSRGWAIHEVVQWNC